MKTIGYTSLLVGALAFGLVGCGGSSYDGAEAPHDASASAFCAVVADIDLNDPKSFVEDLVEVGTPADIPADARSGFEVMVENATEDEISDADQEKVNAFVAYFTSTCAGDVG